MQWPRLLAYITGRVDKELLVRNEYLAAENRILRAKIKGRLQLSDGEKRSLAEIAHRVGRKALAEGDHFLTTVLKGSLKFVKGEQRDLDAITRK